MQKCAQRKGAAGRSLFICRRTTLNAPICLNVLEPCGSFYRSHKGSGLALVGEILAGPLVGAAFCGLGDSKENWGHLVFAIDPGILGDRDEFIRNVGEICKKVKATRTLPGVAEIFVAGEQGSRFAKERLACGEIEVEDNLLVELRKVAGITPGV